MIKEKINPKRNSFYGLMGIIAFYFGYLWDKHKEKQKLGRKDYGRTN